MSTFKRSFFLTHVLLCLFLATSVQASKYYVYKFSDNVSHFVKNEARQPSMKVQLTLRDRFVLGDGAFLAIIDKESNRLYYTRKAGVQTVAQIVSNARKQSREITSLASRQAFHALQEPTKRASVLGAVSRGQNHDSDTTYLIYAALYEAINKSHIPTSSAIVLNQFSEGDEDYFIVQNTTDMPLFANIIKLASADEKPQLCLEVDATDEMGHILVAPRQQLALTQYPFAQQGDEDQYLLFATEYPFDTQALKLLLKSGKEPEKSQKHVKLYLCFPR